MLVVKIELHDANMGKSFWKGLMAFTGQEKA
jgi:hypothetical protein